MVWALMLVSQGWGCHCWCSCLLLVFHRIRFRGVVLIKAKPKVLMLCCWLEYDWNKNERSESGVTLVQRCHCWFKTILFLLPLVQNDSLLYYLLPGTGRLFALSWPLSKDATMVSCLWPPVSQSSFFIFWDSTVLVLSCDDSWCCYGSTNAPVGQKTHV